MKESTIISNTSFLIFAFPTIKCEEKNTEESRIRWVPFIKNLISFKFYPIQTGKGPTSCPSSRDVRGVWGLTHQEWEVSAGVK